MPEHDGDSLPVWARQLLQGPVSDVPALRERIMQQVRTMPAPRSLSAPMQRSRWIRRGLLTPVGSALATCVLAIFLSLRVGGSGALSATWKASAQVIGDSVVPKVNLRHGSSFADTLLDTLRVVEFVVRGQGIRSVVVVGDFNAWRVNATRMSGQRDSVWRVRALVPRDALRFAYMVNDSHFIPAGPLPEPGAGISQRPI